MIIYFFSLFLDLFVCFSFQIVFGSSVANLFSLFLVFFSELVDFVFLLFNLILPKEVWIFDFLHFFRSLGGCSLLLFCLNKNIQCIWWPSGSILLWCAFSFLLQWKRVGQIFESILFCILLSSENRILSTSFWRDNSCISLNICFLSYLLDFDWTEILPCILDIFWSKRNSPHTLDILFSFFLFFKLIS